MNREVAFEIGFFAIRWYGVLYVLAFGLAWYLLPRLAKYRDLKLSRDDWNYIFACGLLGVVVGGRLGYVLLYEPGYFWERPAEIFAIWNGGMASHGGFIGVGLALWLAASRLNIDFWKLLDVVTVPAALGLALGRVGNFINQELFFPPALAFLAVGKNLLIAGVCWWYLRKIANTPGESLRDTHRGVSSAGFVFALFLFLYGILRFLIEFLRVQEFSEVFGLSRGQILTLPVMLGGGLLLLWRQKSGSEPEPK